MNEFVYLVYRFDYKAFNTVSWLERIFKNIEDAKQYIFDQFGQEVKPNNLDIYALKDSKIGYAIHKWHVN